MNGILHPYELGKELGKHIYLENLVKIRRDRKDLPRLIEQAKSFATDLRQIEQDKLEGKLLQDHNLRNYWSEKEISQFYKLTDTFGITETKRKKGDKPATDFMEDHFGVNVTESIDAVINSKIINYKNNIYAIGSSNKIDAIRGVVLPAIMGAYSAFVAGHISTSPIQDWVKPDATLGEIIGLYAGASVIALFSVYNAFFVKWHFKDSYEKNPFSNLANRLEKNADWLEKQIKENLK